jgi:4'-phosphopantetheinyl transferase
LEQLLAQDETDRALRFRFRQLYEKFVISHGVLRCLLARYLNCNPADIEFTHGCNGKPFLKLDSALQFNMTHSGQLAVIAFGPGCEIGIDAEQIRPIPDMQQIADRFFCPEEASELLSLPETDREHAFYRCWTRKEAYLKAMGDGLAAALGNFRVTVQPNLPARLVHIQNETSAAGAWTVQDIDVSAGYAAALVYRDQPRSVSLLRLADPAELISSTPPQAPTGFLR